MKAAAVLARLFFCLAFVAGGAVAPAFAQSEENTKIAKLKQKAEQGDVYALEELSRAYFFSSDALDYGVQANKAKALKWARLAVAQQNSSTYNRIGTMYEQGWALKQDSYKAYIWYSLANNANYSEYYLDNVKKMQAKLTPEQIAKAKMEIAAIPKELAKTQANFNAGKKYEKGDGTLPNYKEAVRLYSLAAEKGHVFAQYSLGLMYLNGKAVAQDYSEAYIRFALVAFNFPDSSFFVKFRQEAEEKLTTDEVNQAQAEAAKRLEAIDAMALIPLADETARGQ